MWYGDSPSYRLLLPLAWLFGGVAAARRALYARGILRSHDIGVPVIVVGNITAGGTGKTPVSIWLAEELKTVGEYPAIVSRGYGGDAGRDPVTVTEDSDPGVAGDEAVLMAAQTRCPIVVHPDRVRAAQAAVAAGATIIVADDGLQHYRLHRDVEIAVIDGDRGFGNGRLLPAGPLREPVSRLESVDRILLQRGAGDAIDVLRRRTDEPPTPFVLRPSYVSRLDRSETRSLDSFSGTTVHAVAGIGNPERFFAMLETAGIEVIRHPLPDHADIGPGDISFDDALDVLMTEKDAVKCRWLDTRLCWYVPVKVEFDASSGSSLMSFLMDRAGCANG